MRKQPIVAIDGPAGSGKSTVAKLLASRLGFTHVDTGALYRAVGLLSLRAKIDLSDEKSLVEELHKVHLEFRPVNSINRLFLNGEDISDSIRTEAVSTAASKVSAFPGVRAVLLGIQRSLGGRGASVLEGRDIGTVIFPDAEVKIFLTANIKERARRRTAELKARGEYADAKHVLTEMERRDSNDSKRAHSPLKKAEDAIEIDTTALTIDKVLQQIEFLVKNKQIAMES